MPAAPAVSVPAISPGEMQLLLSRAGLVLNPGQLADLVLAWRQVVGLVASISPDRPLADDMALVFRLPPPVTAPAPPAERAPVKAKSKVRAGSAKKAKPAPKRPASRSAVSKRLRRGQ